MPSKEFASKSLFSCSETTATSTIVASYHQNNITTATSTKDMVPREVDELVNEIKFNLRLKSNCVASGAAVESPSTTSNNKPSVFDTGTTTTDAMFVQHLHTNGCSNAGNISNKDNSVGGCMSASSSTVFRTKSRPFSRTAPYFVPAKSGSDSGCYSCGSPRCFRSCVRQTNSRMNSDPYQLLQELLKEGGLIKEAVRRISTTPDESAAYTGVKCYDYDKDDYESASAPGINLIGLEA